MKIKLSSLGAATGAFETRVIETSDVMVIELSGSLQRSSETE